MHYISFFVLIGVPIVLSSARYIFRKNLRQQNNSQDITFVLFDFDGTLADTLETAISTCNILATQYNLPTITAAQKQAIRHRSMRDFITKTLKIPWYKIPFFHHKATRFMAQNVTNLAAFNDIDTMLRHLKKYGYRLGIITSNNKSAVGNFLKKNNLEIFDVIYTNSSLFGKHRVINRFLRKYQLNPYNTVYVGDEVRDIKAAQTSGIPIIAVGWGFNSHEILLSHNPDALINHPQELVSTLQIIQQNKKAASRSS